MKIKDRLKSEWPQVLLLAVPFLVLVPLWAKFPERVAIHWGLNGQPNGWASKEVGLLLGPVINIGIVLILAFASKVDKRMKTYSPETRDSLERVLKIIRLVFSVFMTAVALLIDAVALGWKLDVLRVTTVGTLLLFAVLGNYLPKLRPNRFAGIRTPWTLKSPEVWQRTHRLFGAIMLIGSLALMVPCLFLPSPWAIGMLLGFVLATSLGSMIYSYNCYKTINAEE